MQLRSKIGLKKLTILVLGLWFTILRGAWIDSYQTQLSQPDGSTIDVFLSGDEFHNWVHDEAGFTIIQDPITGFWCWGRAVNGDVISTGNPVHLYDPASMGLNPRENISEESYRQRRAELESESETRNATRAPAIGEVYNIVVFIRFSDSAEFTTGVSHYDAMFNNQGVGVNSMFQYFWTASFQSLYVHSPFFPLPNGNQIVSYQSPHPRSYFEPQSATNPGGYSSSSVRNSRRNELLRGAIEFIEPMVPTEWQISSGSENSARVHNVNFIVRGGPGAWADLLWPHMANIGNVNPAITIHGVRVGTYNFNIETITNDSGVGVLAHEFGHSMGLPDFYRYNTTGFHPTGNWDLMASDANPPQSILAHAQQKYLGWLPTIPTITESGFYTLNPLSYSQENVAYRINSPFSTTEYFVVEYRNKTLGLIDSTIPGTGLIVYRINTRNSNGNNLEGNAQGPPDEVYIYRPGGTLTANGQLGSAFFSADWDRTAINDMTNPNSFLQNGSPGGLFISHIGTPDETISFYVNIGGADPDDFDESFENQVFTDFDWVLGSTAPWYITDEYASHGVYSATSGNIEQGQSSRLEINMIVNTGFMQFFVKTSTYENNDFLKFYIDNQEIESWSGETDWTHFSVPVLAGQKSFSWVYTRSVTGGGENKVWIDQIGFPEITGHLLYPPTDLTYSVDDRDINLNWSPPYFTSMPNPPLFLGYSIYQNTVLLNSEYIQENTFTVKNTAGGNMQFWVVADYDIGESFRSNTVNVSQPFITPINLTASSEIDGIMLNWEFPFETPFLFGFRVHKNGQMLTIPVLASDVFSFLDTNVVELETYSYDVRALFTNPSGISEPSNVYEILYTSIEDTPVLFKNELRPNYPNPFNPETIISFSLEKDSEVKLEIFNIRGALVRTLINDPLPKGAHSSVWNGTDHQGNPSASGVYFYKLSAGSFESVRKMVLIK